MDEKQPITKEGFEKLNTELNHLIRVDRPQIVKDIQVARSYGDLKENAEYHSAKEKQGMIEAKVNKLSSEIANSEIIDINKLKGSVVKFGAIVHFENHDTGKESFYQVVGPYESDIDNNKISVTSPIGKALIGKQEGDDIEIKIPKGMISITIIKVSYP